MSQFLRVFTRKSNTAAVKTDKAEEKLLDDDQYVPPPGHIGFLKTLIYSPLGGTAQFVSLGGSRMQDSRTWNHASDLYSRSLDWKGHSFDVGELSRLNRIVSKLQLQIREIARVLSQFLSMVQVLWILKQRNLMYFIF